VIIGSRGDTTITPRDLMSRMASVHAMMLWATTDAEEKEIHAGIIAGLEVSTLRPIVGKEIPLAEASRGHKEVLQPGAFGKIVLVP
jgi:NADPH:quinone reductase